MFSRILVANRGEIAVRIIQTCREMGIETVAVYSTGDVNALHVQRADQAYAIGPAPASQSYLNIDMILTAARQSGAEAIHPGYGFLAENAGFARAVQEAGLAWIGPPPNVIALLGDKAAAKKLAKESGVPVIPGYGGDDQDAQVMMREAERIGYPVMIKAAAGGGGKGMRVVENSSQMQAALDAARREALSAFGDGRLFLEKLLFHPRHIEIQILADAHGHAVFLGERECSLQRRHQKVLEEAPSPIMTPEIRAAMGEAALRLARAAGYVNAGTVEFLFAGDQYYFLEVNTRLQVEHPVTEMVTGYDLVRHQIEIAASEPLKLSQLDVELRGHAIEARLYAEDPANQFLPATGHLAVYRPPFGDGTRNDIGVFEGDEISPYYDPILAKLVVHAETRHDTIERLQRALDRYAILGVTTNIGFLHWISHQADFVNGRMDTTWVERHWPPEEGVPFPEQVAVAAAAAELTQWEATAEPNPWTATNGWRPGGLSRVFRFEGGGRSWDVRARPESDGGWQITIGGASRSIHVDDAGPGLLMIREQHHIETFAVSRIGDEIHVFWRGRVYCLGLPATTESASSHRGTHQASLSSPMPGTVVKVVVQPGQRVKAREPLLVMEAMKMEHVIEAPHDGIVQEVLFHEGDMVPAGAPVVRLGEE